MQPITSQPGDLGLLFDEDVNRDNRTSLPSAFSGAGGGGGGGGGFVGGDGSLEAGNVQSLNPGLNEDNSTTNTNTSTGISSTSDLKAEALGLINQLTSAFGTLFGNIDTAVADQQRVINEITQRNLQQVEGDRIAVGDQTQRQFAARGLGDSSFLAKGVGEVDRQAAGLVADEQRVNQQELAELGKFRATTEAPLKQEELDLARVREQIPSLDTVELQNLADSLVVQLADVRAKQEGFQTEGDFINELQQIAPEERITSSLSLLAQDPSATTDGKIQIARGLIQNSGLDPSAQQTVWAQFLAGLGVEQDEETEL